jgi:tetratricopeptide (TPR) repeat protein/DNA-binding winged helix-turn-helix (wHTH) protein
MKAVNKQLYRFEDFEVDQAAGLIRRQGEEQYLRQKSFQVLVFLIEQRHRLVTKDELIDTIWDGLAVTDDTLVQSVMDIRRTLGESARHPRLIKTVAKSGYRFIGQVEEYYPEAPVFIQTRERTTVEVEYEEEITAATCGEGNPQAQAAELLSLLPRSPRRPLAFAVLAVATIVTLGLAVFFGQQVPQSSSPKTEVILPHVAGRKAVAVLYFDNQSASADLDWLRQGLPDMIITGLSRSKRLTILSRQQLYILFERTGRKPGERMALEDALDIARRSRAETIVMGSFARLGETIRIDAQIHEAQTGQLVAAEFIVADKPEQILDQVDLLSFKLTSHLAPADDTEGPRLGLSDVMTTNLQAYRYYSLALEKAEALHNKEALALLEQSLTLDPEFAMAHARIGYVYAVTWSFAEQARPHLEKAYQLSHRLTEKDRLYIGAWYRIANLEYAAAIHDFRQLISQFPLEVEAYIRLGRLLGGEERAEEAIEIFKQGLVADPEAREIYNSLGGLYICLGRHDEAIASHQHYLQLAPTEPNAYDSLGLSYQWAGRFSEAIEQYNRALALDPEFEVARIHLANLHFQQGRDQEAIRECQQYIQVAPSDAERARGYATIAQIYLQRGKLEQARKAATQMLKYDKAQLRYYPGLALAVGEKRQVEKLKQQFLADWQSTPHRGGPIPLRFPYHFRGYFDLKEGRTDEAIENFKEALRHYPLCWAIDSYEDCLANAYLEANRLDEAIAEYDRILRLNPNYPLAYYHLAQAFERKGDHEQARSNYQRFLQVWDAADPDIPQLIDARQRLTALQ